MVHGVTGEICEFVRNAWSQGSCGPPEKSSSGVQVPRAVTASSLSVREWRHHGSLIPMRSVPNETFGSIGLTQAAAVARRGSQASGLAGPYSASVPLAVR